MNEKHRKIIINILKVLFILYIVALTYFLFFSERYGRDVGLREYRYNLTLFKELGRFVTYRQQLGIESFIVNIFGNILAFAPFGFLLPIITPENRKWIKLALITFLFSLTIELLQLVFKVGIFDVDDLLMNTLGGLLGYFIFTIVNELWKRIDRGA